MKRFCFLAIALIGLSSPALPHATKLGSTPEDGARLTTAPEVIRLAWDDAMRVTMVTLVRADGTETALELARGTAPARSFEVAPGPLAPGSYRVEWRGLASDGHAMQGSFSFELLD